MKIELYCDESRQDLFNNKKSITENNRYICIGGLWIESDVREEIKNNIKVLQEKYKIFGEFKWKTVTPSKYSFYEELIDLFFNYNNSMRFRCVVIDATKVDMDTYNNSDSELGFYKFYYQLLTYWINNKNQYKIYTDYKVNRKNDRLNELKDVLNNKVRSLNTVQLIQAINSKESLLLQLEDVLMGAVAYKYNYRDAGTAIAKNKLIKKIEEILDAKITDNNKYNSKFNIFKINLRGKKN